MTSHSNDIEFDDSAGEDITPDAEEFEVDELIFPYAPPQQWVSLHPKLGKDAVSVYGFLMDHVNPHNGKFIAYPGRMRIAERYGMSADWVDKQLKALIKVGALSKKWTYWRDANDHSRGRSVNPRDTYGNKRQQAPNRYTVHLKPPQRERHPHPIKISEYYKPWKVKTRIEAYGGTMPEEAEAAASPGSNPEVPGKNSAGERGAATQRPPNDQGKQREEGPSDFRGGGPPHSGPRGAATQRPGGPPHSGPKEHGGNDHGDGKEHGGSPSTGPSLRSGACTNNEPGRSDYGETKQSNLISESSPARAPARETAESGHPR